MFPKMQPCTAELWPGWACVCTFGTVPEVKNSPPPNTSQSTVGWEKDPRISLTSDSRKGNGKEHLLSTHLAPRLPWSFSYRLFDRHSFSKFSQLSKNLSFIWLSLIPWAHIVWDTIPIRETRDNPVAHTHSNLQPSVNLHSQKVFQHPFPCTHLCNLLLSATP